MCGRMVSISDLISAGAGTMALAFKVAARGRKPYIGNVYTPRNAKQERSVTEE